MGCRAGEVPCRPAQQAGLPKVGTGGPMAAHLAQRAQQLHHPSVGREGGDQQQRTAAAPAPAAHNGHPDLLAEDGTRRWRCLKRGCKG